MGDFLKRIKSRAGNAPRRKDKPAAEPAGKPAAENTPGENGLSPETVEKLSNRKGGDPFATFYGSPNSKKAAKLQTKRNLYR